MESGRKGDDVTTTGGPDQSFADPATTTQPADYPVVVRDGRDGDDLRIEVEVDQPGPHHRTRMMLVGAVVVVLAAGGVAAALATRHHHHAAAGASKLSSVAPASPAAAHPKTPAVGTEPRTITGKPATEPTVKTPPANPAVIAPTVSAPPNVVSPPPAVTPATPPPVTVPPAEPTSVLQWKSTPVALSVKGGAHISFTVTVTNPTSGTVTLPTPLSCAPVLRGPHGAAFGFTVCEQMAQLMSPHQQLTQRYTIYATATGDPSGRALKPGAYTATVEGLYNVKVHITAS